MFKIIRNNCCGLDVHKTWIYACIGITDSHSRTDYHEARFSSFPNDLRRLADWLHKHNCTEVCMESSGKYWIPVFNALENSCQVTLAHPKYTKPQKGNKTDRKDARWICDLFMCGMIKPSFIPPPAIRHLRDLVRYRQKLTNMLTGEKNRAQNCLTVSGLKIDDAFADVWESVKFVFDFFRIDILSACAEQHILAAAFDIKKSVGIHDSEVAGVIPSVGIEGLGGFFFVFVVSLTNVHAAREDFAHDMLRIFAVDFDFHAGSGFSA